MIKRKWNWSLRAQLAVYILLGLVCSVCLYWGASALGEHLIFEYYMAPEAIARREQRWVETFDEYVQREQIASTDTDAIGSWSRQCQYAYLLVFRSGTLAVEAGSWGADTVEQDEEFWYLSQDEYGGDFYPVEFTDTVCAVTAYDFSEQRLYTLKTIFSILLAGIVFLLIVMRYNSRLRSRIVVLSRDVREIAAGNLDKQILTSGRDELTSLAEDMDQMRLSIVEQMNNEKQAWQANADLIRAISHDIRTPLTTLTGYLDLATGEQTPPPEQMQQYLEICRNKATQLRQLTDRLFRYFLVFSNQELELDLQQYDAQILMQQLLTEQIAVLEGQGFSVRWHQHNSAVLLYTDVGQLQRVMDNLMSNVTKYARRDMPVEITQRVAHLKLHVRICNAIDQSGQKVESNKIGLRTCQKLMECLGGALQVEHSRHQFCVELTLPVRPVTSPEPEAEQPGTE